MLLSILIPMFNADQYIVKCLDSIYNQGLNTEDFEVIVINDNSTDASESLVENYKKNYPNIILHTTNNKCSYRNRNQALAISRGKYVYFMDADDYLVANALQPLLTEANKNQLDLIGFGTEVVYTRENPVIEFKATGSMELTSGPDYIKKHKNTRFEVWWYLINRDYLDHLNIRFYEGKLHADVAFTLEVLVNARKMGYCAQNVYRYFQSPSSIMRTKTKESLDARVESSKVMLAKINDIFLKTKKQFKAIDPQLIMVLQLRMYEFVYLFLSRMIKNGYSYREMKKIFEYLQKIGLYPIKKFTGNEFTGFKYEFLRFLFNRPILLNLLIKARPYLR